MNYENMNCELQGLFFVDNADGSISVQNTDGSLRPATSEELATRHAVKNDETVQKTQSGQSILPSHVILPGHVVNPSWARAPRPSPLVFIDNADGSTSIQNADGSVRPSTEAERMERY